MKVPPKFSFPPEVPIWVDPERMSGTPCFKGTRVPVDSLFTNLESPLPSWNAPKRPCFNPHENPAGCVRPASAAAVSPQPHCPHRTGNGLSRLKNGKLLQVVEREFDAFLTSDQNLKYQQNIAGRKLATLVLPTNDWPTLRRITDKIAATVATLKSGDFLELAVE